MSVVVCWLLVVGCLVIGCVWLLVLDVHCWLLVVDDLLFLMSYVVGFCCFMFVG